MTVGQEYLKQMRMRIRAEVADGLDPKYVDDLTDEIMEDIELGIPRVCRNCGYTARGESRCPNCGQFLAKEI